MSRPHKKRKTITVTMEGGLIQDITGIPVGFRVVVMDFDTEGAEESDLHTTRRGEKYFRSTWLSAQEWQKLYGKPTIRALHVAKVRT